MFSDRLVRKAEKALQGLDALHFPIVFPQAFLGERGGFDVILGNPPWEKLQAEEHEFWARHFPGYRGLTQSERVARLPKLKRERPDLTEAFQQEREQADALRDVILNGPYPGMGSGHPDLYKAFSWRFWSLVAPNGGYIGVVLPRAVFSAKGSEAFRRAVFSADGMMDMTTLVNSRGWVFDDVHPQFSISLAAIRRGGSDGAAHLALRGPFQSHDVYDRHRAAEPVRFAYTAVREWTSTYAVPLLPTNRSATIFAKIRRSPRLDDVHRDWSAVPIQGDLNSTTGAPFMTFGSSPNKTYWPVYAGEAFDLWEPDRGRYYATAEAKPLVRHLQERRLTGSRRARGAFSSFDPEVLEDESTLPCLNARLAFRRITRATDSRTVRTALVAPRVFLVDTAPFMSLTDFRFRLVREVTPYVSA